MILPVLLWLSPNGIVFVERLSSYWLPLLPYAYNLPSNFKKTYQVIINSIIIFVAISLFLLWSVFSSMADEWIPYKNIIFINLFNIF